jgi:hypothetical protein
MSADPDYREIEHKFIVGPDFDLGDFRRRASALLPTRTTELRVQDTYFVTALAPGVVFRHRYDSERQELTVKSRGPGDTEVRREVNLRLDQALGSQLPAVTAFLSSLSILWQGSLTKDILVYYYPDCEVVYYAASGPARQLCCVEFEAVDSPDLDAARATLAAYEQRLGLGTASRVRESLFDLLLLPEMNAQAQRA